MATEVYDENGRATGQWRHCLEGGPGLLDLMQAMFLPNDDGSPHRVAFRVSELFPPPKEWGEFLDVGLRIVVVEIVGVDRQMDVWKDRPGSFTFRGRCTGIRSDYEGERPWPSGYREDVCGEINVQSRVGHIEFPVAPYVSGRTTW